MTTRKPNSTGLGVCLAVLFLSAGAARAQVTNVSINPSSGSSASGVPQSFIATYSDSLGGGDITEMEVLVNTNSIGYGGCYTAWAGSGLYLQADDGSTWLGPITPGSAGTLQNSHCTLYATGSSLALAGNQATLTVRVSFTAAFAGSKYTHMRVFGNYSNTIVQQIGAWTIGATGYPDLTITKNHSGNFTQGQSGTYTNHRQQWRIQRNGECNRYAADRNDDRQFDERNRLELHRCLPDLYPQ